MGRLNDGGRVIKTFGLNSKQFFAPGKDEKTVYEKIQQQAKVDGFDSMSELVGQLLMDWWKKFGNGNPGFTLDNFTQDPNFSAMPAYSREITDWKSWLQKQNAESFKEWDLKLNQLLSLSNQFNQKKFHDPKENPNNG